MLVLATDSFQLCLLFGGSKRCAFVTKLILTFEKACELNVTHSLAKVFLEVSFTHDAPY